MRDFLREMQEHYAQVMSAGKGDEKKKVSITYCPTTWNKPCKLCDICKEVLFNQDKHTPEKIEAAREINRKPKFYANVVLVTNPAEVRLFEYGKIIGDKLGIYEMGDSDLKGFSHPTNGRNLVIVRYPHPEKRKTRYDIEPRMAMSPLVDRSVLSKLYNLDDVPTIVKSGGVQVLYQSKLEAQRTEIRWLPSWLGPEFASVFQVKYFVHYHIGEDEFDAITRGEFNPLEDNKEPKIVVPTPIVVPAQPTPAAPKANMWDDLRTPVNPIPTWDTTSVSTTPVAPAMSKPVCYGTYDEDLICTEKCDSKYGKGTLRACQVETEAQLLKRRQARGLYK